MTKAMFGAAAVVAAFSASVWAGDNLPPFDFSDQFYTANGINAAALIGRPVGNPPGSIIDNRENGPELNNVRILGQAAAYDHGGNRIFFYVTGLPTLASFLDNSAGRQALEIAERYNVYEFPRAGNGQFAVFPKRQDLIADLRNGYFSNNPLGVWKINLVRFTPAAFDTDAGRAALAQLAARNGHDLDGTPIVKTLDEIEVLRTARLVTIDTPPSDGGPGVFRWFFCPVIENPRDGAIAPDAFLDVTENEDAGAFVRLFDCYQRNGRECGDEPVCRVDWNRDGVVNSADFFAFLGGFFGGGADFNVDGTTNSADFFAFLQAFFNPGPGC
jgi:hypothetical protein